MTPIRPRTTTRRRLALLAVPLLAAAVSATGASAAETATDSTADTAAQPGSILYSPDLDAHPEGTAGYPRAIALEHDAGDGEAMLATYAKGGHDGPTTLPIQRSDDGGQTWTEIAEVGSNTPGWDLEAPTLFEVPRDLPGLDAGDVLASGTAWEVGDYTAQKVEVFRSGDGGQTWQFLSNCTETSGMPDEWGHGIWEPTFLVADDDTLACFISDERPEDSPTNDQRIGHYTSEDGGTTWSETLTDDVVFGDDDLARPGMQTFAELPDGRVAMSYEMCRDATDANHACEVYIKFSDDGLDWGPPGEAGTLVQTAEGKELLHTPYLSWTPGGGPDGTLLLSGQRVVSGPTGDKTVHEESGEVLFANTDLGEGDWFQAPTPVTVDPTGGYDDDEPACPGYSTPAIPRADGESYLYLAATWLETGDQCEMRYGIGTVPGTDTGAR